MVIRVDFHVSGQTIFPMKVDVHPDQLLGISKKWGHSLALEMVPMGSGRLWPPNHNRLLHGVQALSGTLFPHTY